MKYSKYVEKYEFREYVAYYHSLRMKPVFLSKDEASELEHALYDTRTPHLNSEVLDTLKKYLILVDSDENVIEHVRNYLPSPYICLAYFVLSEQCNLACKYCFLGNSEVNVPKVTNYPMSKETADKALLFFGKQTQQDMEQFNDVKEIIFYGGEPLINFETLKYVVDRSRHYQKECILGSKLKFSIITNGLLLDEEKIRYMIDNHINVSISIDGADEFANDCRVDKSGVNIYKQLICKLLLAKKMGLEYGLSITLTEHTISDMDKLLKLIEDLNVKSVCFNILLKSKDYGIENEYYVAATDFIIEFYKRTKSLGIYEDRFMRKLKSFAESRIYFSDCAATSGSQIVITPDGGVGICHGCMENRDYFIGSVDDDNLIVEKNDEVIKWSRLSPVFKTECQKCPALGICGGGCPINAKKIDNTDSINAVDKAYCVHAKNILKYLIQELLRLALEQCK